MRLMILAAVVSVAVVGVAARQGRGVVRPMPPGARPAAVDSSLVDSTRTYYTAVKGWLTSAASLVSENAYEFRPATKPASDGRAVRTFGEILAHVASSNRQFCGAAEGLPAAPSSEPTARTKTDIQQALAASFVVCDRVWNATGDANAATLVTLPAGLGPSTRLGALVFITNHLAEHYGNIVTYLRIEGIVPPSS